MKSVENIFGYIREQFYRFSRGCKPRENLWNCLRKYPKMFETYFIFRQQKIEFKPMSGVIMLLCNRMFCWIFGGIFPTSGFPTSGFFQLPIFHHFRFGSKPEMGKNRKWKKPEVEKTGSGKKRKWEKTGSGEKPEVVKNRKWWKPEVGKNRKWWKTGSGTKPEVCSNQKLDSNYWNEAKLLRNYSICQL